MIRLLDKMIIGLQCLKDYIINKFYIPKGAIVTQEEWLKGYKEWKKKK